MIIPDKEFRYLSFCTWWRFTTANLDFFLSYNMQTWTHLGLESPVKSGTHCLRDSSSGLFTVVQFNVLAFSVLFTVEAGFIYLLLASPVVSSLSCHPREMVQHQLQLQHIKFAGSSYALVNSIFPTFNNRTHCSPWLGNVSSACHLATRIGMETTR